ncbi:protein of unknown function [Rhodovastum atsumiense]|nr:protein of unknown function [Rhodovastum atsumiense]
MQRVDALHRLLGGRVCTRPIIDSRTWPDTLARGRRPVIRNG